MSASSAATPPPPASRKGFSENVLTTSIVARVHPHIYTLYLVYGLKRLPQDGDADSRWTCGPLASGSRFYRFEDCELDFSLNYYRYIRQIQFGEFPNTRVVIYYVIYGARVNVTRTARNSYYLTGHDRSQ